MFKKTKSRIQRLDQLVMSGLQFFFRAHYFIFRNSLKRYMIFSGIFFLAIFSLGINALVDLIDRSEPGISAWIIRNIGDYINLAAENLETGIKSAFWLLKSLIKTNSDAIFNVFFMIIGVPYFSLISRKVYRLVTGRKQNNPNTSFGKSLRRGLRISLRNTGKQLLFLLLITGLSFIPVVGIFTPLFSFIISTYYYGIILSDYIIENIGLDVKASREYYNKHKIAMFSFGLGYMFLMQIPVIGWFVAPTYALVASSLYALDLFGLAEKKNDFN